ncbi:MAG: alpha/beta hydrolase [Pseudomonadota bacterium]
MKLAVPEIHRFIMSDGIALHTEILGDGPVIIFVHGFAGSARNWRGIVRELAAEYRCIVFDARGHARSEAPLNVEHYSIERFQKDIVELLDHLSISFAALVGLSMGAAIGTGVAAQYSHRVSHLVLASLPNIHAQSSIAGQALAMADKIQCEGLEAAGAEFVWGVNAGISQRDGHWVRLGFLEHSAIGLENTLRGCLSHLGVILDDENLINSIKLPTTLLAGSHDLGACEMAYRLHAIREKTNVKIIEDGSHVLHLSSKMQFVSAIKHTLKQSI